MNRGKYILKLMSLFSFHIFKIWLLENFKSRLWLTIKFSCIRASLDQTIMLFAALWWQSTSRASAVFLSGKTENETIQHKLVWTV